MVKSITNLSRSGVQDWLVQRVSAVILAVFTLFLLGVFLANPGLGYEQWRQLFTPLWVKIFTLLTLLSLAGHTWIGMWTVVTDYLHNPWVRFVTLFVIAVITFVYLIVGITALWGV